MARRNVGGVEVDVLANTAKFESQVKEATDAASENDVEIGVVADEAELEDAVQRIRRKARETDAAAGLGINLNNADIESTLADLREQIAAISFDATVGLELAASARAILAAEVEIAVAELRPEVLVGLAIDFIDVQDALFDLAILVEAAQANVHVGAQLDVIDVEEAIAGVELLALEAHNPQIPIGAEVDNTDVEEAIAGVGAQVALANAAPGGPSIGIGAHVNNASIVAAVNQAGATAAAAAAGTPGGGGGAGGGGGPFGQAGQAAGNSFWSGFGSLGRTEVLAGLIAAFGGPLITGATGIASSAFAIIGSAVTAISAGAIALIPLGFTLGTSFGAAAIGFHDVGGALKAVWDQDPEALAKAMEKLSPSAAAFVQAIADSDVIDTIKGIQEQVQENLFKNLDDQVAGLATKTVPEIGDALGLAASDVNQFFTEVSQVIQGHDFRQMFADLQPANTAIFGGISTTLDTLLDVVSRATPLANELAGSFEGIANHVNDIVNSQDFLDFLETGRASLEAWGHLLSPLLGSLVQLFEIGAQPANTFLTSLGDATKEFQNFTESAKGKNQISEFFTKGFAVLKGFAPILRGLGKGIANLFDDQSIKTFLTAAKGLGKALPTIFGALDIAGAFFAPIIDAIGDLFQAFEPLLPLLERLAPLIGEIFAGQIRIWAAAIKALMPVLKFLVESMIGLATAVDFVVDHFVGFVQLISGFVAQGLDFIIEKVGQFADFLLANIGPALSTVLPAVIGIAEGALRLFGAAWDGIRSAAEAVWNWFTGTLIPFLQTGFDAAISAAKTVIGGLATAWDAIKSAAGAVWDWLSGTLFPRLGPDGLLGSVMDAAAAVLSVFSDAWDTIKSAAGAVWDWLSGTLFPRLGPDGLLGTAMDAAATVLGLFADAWDAIKSAAAAVWDWLSGTLFPRLGAGGLLETTLSVAAGFISAIADGWSAIKTAAGAVWDWLTQVLFPGFGENGLFGTAMSAADTAIGWVETAFNTLKTTAETVWTFIVDAGHTALDGLISVVNGIIDGFNLVISGLNLIPGVDIPKIPKISVTADAEVNVASVTVTPGSQTAVANAVAQDVADPPPSVDLPVHIKLAQLAGEVEGLPLIGSGLATRIAGAAADAIPDTAQVLSDVMDDQLAVPVGEHGAMTTAETFAENFAPFLRRATFTKAAPAVNTAFAKSVKNSDFDESSKRVVNAIGTGIEDQADDIRTSIGALILTAAAALATAVVAFRQAGFEMMAGLNQGITLGEVAVTLNLVGFGARAVRALGPVQTVFVPSGIALMAGLAAGVTAGTFLLSAALLRAVGAVSGAAGAFAGAGRQLSASLLNGISSGMQNVTSFMHLVPVLLVLALGNLSNTFYSQGQQLAAGLIAGFNARIAAGGLNTPSTTRTNAGSIPRAAAGMVVGGPTLALIGEGRGREAVIPLDAPLGQVSPAVRPMAAQLRGQGGLTVNQTIVTQTEDTVSVAAQVVNRMSAEFAGLS